MKKNIVTIIVIFMLVFTIANVICTVQAIDIEDIDQDKASRTTGDNSKLKNMGNVIISIVRRGGEAIAVFVLVVIGIRYIIGSVEEKAEYKQTMWPYIIGAVLIFAGAEVTNIIYTMVRS